MADAAAAGIGVAAGPVLPAAGPVLPAAGLVLPAVSLGYEHRRLTPVVLSSYAAAELPRFVRYLR